MHRLVSKLRYRFDNTISRGTLPVILWLATGVAIVVVIGGAIIAVAHRTFGGQTDDSVLESIWQSMLRVIDGGTFVADSGWGVRLLGFVITIFGITVAALLIGLIGTAIQEKVDALRRGRSPVVERNHTLVLGWSSRIFTVVSEIIEADASRQDSAIVVLSARDKLEMEHEIAHRVRDTRRTRVVCRSGDPSSLHDLTRVGIDSARSVVVLGDVDGGDGDAQVVKSVLAVLLRLDGREIPVVAELSDAETARALREAGPGCVEVVRSPEVIARVAAQACRESGLSAVWQDLLDFEGDEIYFHPADDLVGHRFGEALLAFERAAVLGRRSADGTVQIDPAADTRFEAGDEVILLAEDDDAIAFTGIEPEPAGDPPLAPSPPAPPEHVLVIGWNPFAPGVLAELDRFVAHGSTVDVLADADLIDLRDVRDPGLTRLAMSVLPTDRANLDCLADQVRVKDYDVVLILGYRSFDTPASADARTLLTLLLVQRAARRPIRVVTELLDSADIELALASGGDDYVVSDALAGYLMAQLAETPELGEVFDALFEGTEVVLRLVPADGYRDGAATFADVVRAARARGEVALGHLDGSSRQVTLNPPKSAALSLGDGDRVVVIGRAG